MKTVFAELVVGLLAAGICLTLIVLSPLILMVCAVQWSLNTLGASK